MLVSCGLSLACRLSPVVLVVLSVLLHLLSSRLLSTLYRDTLDRFGDVLRLDVAAGGTTATAARDGFDFIRHRHVLQVLAAGHG